MAQSLGVSKWEKIALALHSGALDDCNTFHSTQDIINHLHSYQQPQGDLASVARGHHDFYYHPEKIKGPIGLSELFAHRVSDRCLLCANVSMTLVKGGKFMYNCNNDLRVGCSDGYKQLDLQRLEHVAVLHTPYFLMLFLELVKNKRYVLHTNPEHRHAIALRIYDEFKEDPNGCFAQDLDVTFLKVWWRYQDRVGSRLLGISIPCYLEMHSGIGTWTVKIDSFANRKPNPLYTFLSNKCLCHDIWPSGAAEYAEYTDLSPRVKTVTRDRVSTFSMGILVPKLHSEAHLDSLVRMCETRESRMSHGERFERSDSLGPRLDALVLEDVGHTKAVMMHLVVTLNSHWQTLSSWIAGAKNGQVLDRGDVVTAAKKVSVGVLGSLRDMCLENKRPPRQLYDGPDKLANVFFVHCETQEVLSLLPYVSVNRLFRSSNCPKDEDSFRVACANLTLSVLCAHGGDERATFLGNTTLREWWQLCESALPHASDIELIYEGVVENTCHWQETASLIWNSLRFCKSGLIDPAKWSKVNSEEYGPRDTSAIDIADVWLGENCRGLSALKSKLFAMDFKGPLRVSVIELLDGVETRAQHTVKTTLVPEIHKGLVNAVTIPKSKPNCTNVPLTGDIFSRVCGFGESARCGANKRVHESSCLPEVSTKKSYEVVTDTADTHTLEPSKLSQHELIEPSALSTESTSEIYTDEQKDQLPTSAQRLISESYTNPNFATGNEMDILTELNLTTDSACDLFAQLESTPLPCDDFGVFFVQNEDACNSGSLDGLGTSAHANVYIDYEQVQEGHGSNTFNLMKYFRETFPNTYGCDTDAFNETVYENTDAYGEGNSVIQNYNSENNKVCQYHDQAQAGVIPDAHRHLQINHQRVNLDVHTNQRDCEYSLQLNHEDVYHGTEYQQPVAYNEVWRQSEHYGGVELATHKPPQYTPVVDKPHQAQRAESDDEREASPEEIAFLERYPRWRSNGFLLRILSEIQWTKYKTMTFESAANNMKWSITILQQTGVTCEPVVAPCQGLEVPKCTQRERDTRVPATVVRREYDCMEKGNHSLGVESCTTHGFSVLECPVKLKGYTNLIARQTLSCRKQPQRYLCVDLSKKPDLGFRHVVLSVNEFPIGEDEKNLLKIHSTQAFYLGPVCIIQDVQGLLVHKIFASTTKVLEAILDMHTCVQIHSFVPRTFALQLMKVPFFNKSANGVFIGESPGEWNLGSPGGIATVSEKDRFVLAYNVLKCLLRAQILALKALGFTLGCIQPARIWKHNNGFRLDFLSCLIDTVQKWRNGRYDTSDINNEITLGMAALKTTLGQLARLHNLPSLLTEFFDGTCNAWGPDVFYDMYTKLTQEPVSLHSDLDVILGSDCEYKGVTLKTQGAVAQPYGPFRVQLHNQYFKWNKAIIVEPVTLSEPRLARVDVSYPNPNKPRKKSHKASLSANRHGRDTNSVHKPAGETDYADHCSSPAMSVHSVFFEI